MRNSIIALWTVISIVATGAASEASAAASKQESVGVGTGAIVGAVAGGPIGFIVGAAVGAKIGDNMHKKTEQIDQLQLSLIRSRHELSEMEANMGVLDAEVERLETVSRPQLVALMQAGINLDLLFRTDEFSLTDTTGSRVAELAASLSAMSDVNVQLDGFADERGNEEYNQMLSEKRVEFVRELFASAGVPAARIQVNAHGESVAQDASIDSYALERRVSVKLFIDNPATVAKNTR